MCVYIHTHIDRQSISVTLPGFPGILSWIGPWGDCSLISFRELYCET